MKSSDEIAIGKVNGEKIKIFKNYVKIQWNTIQYPTIKV